MKRVWWLPNLVIIGLVCVYNKIIMCDYYHVYQIYHQSISTLALIQIFYAHGTPIVKYWGWSTQYYNAIFIVGTL